MKIRWITQNEATDADGFLLENEASFAAEIEFLASAGCPDAGLAKLIGVEIVGQDESVTTADVTDRMARWLEEELDGESEEG